MKRINICQFGKIMLQLFCWSTVIASVYLLLGFFGCYARWFGGPEGIRQETTYWLIRLLIVVLVETVIFWIGIITVYLTSEQLGIRWRVLGIICGWIPIAHLIMLHIIIKTVSAEIKMERMRYRRNAERANARIYQTRYPILMVHGVFFRDFEHLNYWGRIPAELQANGSTIYYGNHNSAASVRDSAKELEARILQIVNETGCGKVNVIAHSKGGLDMRAALALTSAAPYVASLTTINTPHRGCLFADYLLGKIPEKQQHFGSRKARRCQPGFSCRRLRSHFGKLREIQCRDQRCAKRTVSVDWLKAEPSDIRTFPSELHLSAGQIF